MRLTCNLQPQTKRTSCLVALVKGCLDFLHHVSCECFSMVVAPFLVFSMQVFDSHARGNFLTLLKCDLDRMTLLYATCLTTGLHLTTVLCQLNLQLVMHACQVVGLIVV